MNIPWSALTKLVAGNHIIPIKMTWGYRQDAFSWSAWRFYEIRRVTLLICDKWYLALEFIETDNVWL